MALIATCHYKSLLRHVGGAILMLFFALAVAVIGNKIFIAMMTSTYQEMKLA